MAISHNKSGLLLKLHKRSTTGQYIFIMKWKYNSVLFCTQLIRGERTAQVAASQETCFTWFQDFRERHLQAAAKRKKRWLVFLVAGCKVIIGNTLRQLHTSTCNECFYVLRAFNDSNPFSSNGNPNASNVSSPVRLTPTWLISFYKFLDTHRFEVGHAALFDLTEQLVAGCDVHLGRQSPARDGL